jgi:hypothetical protein
MITLKKFHELKIHGYSINYNSYWNRINISECGEYARLISYKNEVSEELEIDCFKPEHDYTIDCPDYDYSKDICNCDYITGVEYENMHYYLSDFMRY